MADDGAVDENTRVMLRELARRAEWAVAQADDDAGARRLRQLGHELAAGIDTQDVDESTWAHRATAELATHCQAATSAWSADYVAELDRLREAALTALAPPPGQADLAPSTRRRPSVGLPLTTLPGGRRALAVGLAVVVCAVIAGIAVIGHGGGHGSAPQSSTTTTSASDGLPGDTYTDTDTAATGQASTPTTSTTATATSTANAAQVTAIQMTATAASDYPEVQIYGTITTSGTADVTITVTIAGASGQPQATTEDESGQRSYALSETRFLQPWCGQKSVTVTVSSGSVSKSATVPVSGC